MDLLDDTRKAGQGNNNFFYVEIWVFSSMKLLWGFSEVAFGRWFVSFFLGEVP